MNRYFMNNKIQKRKKYFPNVFYDIEPGGQDSAALSIRETWIELRESLQNNEFNYTDLEKAKKTKFISVLNQLVENNDAKSKITVDLKYYVKSKTFMRAAIVSNEEVVTKDRFIPKYHKMNNANRFSPKGVEWLYIGFDKYASEARKCCLAEVRAKNDDGVKLCEFTYNHGEYRVIDLTIADKMSWDDICHKHVDTPEKTTILFVIELYCKLLSEEIFVPVNSGNKDLEYVPFHCMAQYFKNLGYDGIIYKSTVCKSGRNMVLFDKKIFSPSKIL